MRSEVLCRSFAKRIDRLGRACTVERTSWGEFVICVIDGYDGAKLITSIPEADGYIAQLLDSRPLDQEFIGGPIL